MPINRGASPTYSGTCDTSTNDTRCAAPTIVQLQLICGRCGLPEGLPLTRPPPACISTSSDKRTDAATLLWYRDSVPPKLTLAGASLPGRLPSRELRLAALLHQVTRARLLILW